MTTANNARIDYLNKIDELPFGQRIAHIIETRGISKAWIAERLGISKQALNYLLKHSIKPKFVDEFAELLALDPKWIENGVGTRSLNAQVTKAALSTKLSIVTKSMLLGHTASTEEQNKSIDFSHPNINAFTAYQLDDDSNFPPFIDGSILIFNTEKKPTDGDYVLFTLDNDVFVRQYLIDGSNICYKASNNLHKTFINPKATILGVLVEVRYQL